MKRFNKPDSNLYPFWPIIPILNTFTANNDLALQYSDYQHDYRLLILWKNRHGHTGSISIEPPSQEGGFILYAQCALPHRAVGREAVHFPPDIDSKTLLALLEEARDWIEDCQQPAAEQGLSAEEVYLQQVRVEVNPQVRANAVFRLGEIGTSQAIEGIVAAAQDEDANVRMVALKALGRLRRRGKMSADRVVDVLQHALQDVAGSVRVVAQEVQAELEADSRFVRENGRRIAP
jgi:hypothetical protein